MCQGMTSEIKGVEAVLQFGKIQEAKYVTEMYPNESPNYFRCSKIFSNLVKLDNVLCFLVSRLWSRIASSDTKMV